MIIVRFKIQCQPGKTEQVLAAFKEVIPPSRTVLGVISFDISRDVSDPDISIATEVFEGWAALDRQESLPEVKQALRVLEVPLANAPEATIYHVSFSGPGGLETAQTDHHEPLLFEHHRLPHLASVRQPIG